MSVYQSLCGERCTLADRGARSRCRVPLPFLAPAPLTRLPDLQPGPLGRGTRTPYFLGQEEVLSPEEVTASPSWPQLLEHMHWTWKSCIHISAHSLLQAARSRGVAGGRARAAAKSARSSSKPTSETCQTGKSRLLGALWASHDFLDLGSFVCWKQRTLSVSIGPGEQLYWALTQLPDSRCWRKCGGRTAPVVQEGASQERVDRKCRSPHGSASGGVCVAAVTGWCSACQLPASCPPFCVLQALAVCNYISQAQLGSANGKKQWEVGRHKEGRSCIFHFCRRLLKWQQQRWHLEWAILQPQSVKLVLEMLWVFDGRFGECP